MNLAPGSRLEVGERSAYLIGAVYKDIVVYSLFLCFLWFRPQGLMGKS